MKIKDKIIRINNGNYEDFIALWNSNAEKYTFTKLQSIELDDGNYLFLLEDGSFFNVIPKILFAWFISLNFMDSLQVGDYVKEDWCNKNTLTLRGACNVTFQYKVYNGYGDGIFMGIVFQRNELRVNIYSRKLLQYCLSQRYFVKTQAPVVENNSQRLKQLLSDDESPRQKIKEGLMRASALPFVENLEIKDGNIYFTFLPYQLDLGNGFRVNMPKLKMIFSIQDKKFKLGDGNYKHPHISFSYVCLGTFQSVINSTRWNFDIALITMYEHACTYNLSSPFGGTRPIIEQESNYFYSKCTFEYLGMTYDWNEFLTFLSANFDNWKEYRHTIMGKNSTTDESHRKHLLKIK